MNIWFLFGSQSTEHEVSIASAFGIMQGFLKNTDHKVFPLYITTKGQRVYEPDFLDPKQVNTLIRKDYSDTQFSIDFSKTGKLYATQKKQGVRGKKSDLELDLLFFMLHGKNGEDGTAQGICQILDIPFVSPWVLGSAIGMNKVVMKDVFKSHEIPQTKYIILSQGEETARAKEVEQLAFPLFVKPANLGSSIGVSKVHNEKELQQALEIAFHYDHQAICEQAVSNLVELNCSIIAHKGEIKTSCIEKISTNAHFLSFEEKYLNEGGTMHGIEKKVEIPAKIPAHVEKQVFALCQQVGRVLHVDGGAPRIDFLWDEKNDILYVNEINTIPGAMQLHLWNASGVRTEEFFDMLVENAFWRRDQEKQKSIEFSSSIIDLTVNFKK